MTDRELMQMALDALEEYEDGQKVYFDDEIEALRARLAQPEQAPTNNGRYLTGYTAPPQREWQGLTDEEIEDACWTEVDQRLRSFTRAIEAKLKEKNG